MIKKSYSQKKSTSDEYNPVHPEAQNIKVHIDYLYLFPGDALSQNNCTSAGQSGSA